MTRTPPLLSLDEATEAISLSAIALVDAVPCKAARLARLLYGGGRTTGLGPYAAAAVVHHR